MGFNIFAQLAKFELSPNFQARIELFLLVEVPQLHSTGIETTKIKFLNVRCCSICCFAANKSLNKNYQKYIEVQLSFIVTIFQIFSQVNLFLFKDNLGT